MASTGEEMNWVIYTLRCPRSGGVRYVGWTVRSPKKRLRDHITESLAAGRTHKQRWILSLLSIGLWPVIEIVESGSGDGWQEAERRWIAHYRAAGARLVNGTVGGDSPPPATFEQLSERSKKMWAKMTPQQRTERVQKSIARLTHAQLRARSVLGRSRMTSEQVQSMVAKGLASTTHEQRSSRAKKREAAKTPEQRSANSRKIWLNKAPDERRKIAAAGKATMGAARRSAATRKANATRKAKKGDVAACNARKAENERRRRAGES